MVDREYLEAYIVGGYVRDILLGKEPSDADFVVVGETPESMEKRGFRPIDATSFPVFLDENGDEWALARTEKSNGRNYHDFETFTDGVSIVEDLERRDLTINSMAVPIDETIEEDNIITPYSRDPISDLENRVLRHTSDAFVEDPVRSLRLARFAGRYPSFTIEPQTLEIAQRASTRLIDQPNERIGKEFKKAFNECVSVRRFLEVLDRVNALKRIDKNLEAMKHYDAGGSGKYHKEGSVWNHTLMVVEEMQKIRGNDFKALMMALTHDIGKVKDRKKHTVVGQDMVVRLTHHSLQLPRDITDLCVQAVKQHMRIHNIDPLAEDSMNVGKIISTVDELQGKQKIERLLDLAKADSRGRIPYQEPDIERIRERIELAQEAIDTVDAHYSVDKRDAEIEDYEGEVIGNMVHQDRVEYFREM